MNLTEKSIEIAASFARKSLPRFAMDMTLGNGRDTLALARMVAEGGAVFAFDVQEAAIENSRRLILESGGEALLKKCRMFLLSHDKFAGAVPAEVLKDVSVAFFNLGWLPGSDKSVITRAQSTLPALKALEALFRRRAEDGHDSLLNVLSYRGHEGGSVEYAAVGKFFNSLRAETPLGNARAEVEVYGQRGNPSCPILFSARFFPAR